MNWIVRLNCEYILTVEADSHEEAIEIANQIDCAEWEQEWSPIEAEQEEFL